MNSSPIIYYISGLGADHRAYMFLQIDGYETKNINWVQHADKDSMSDYAAKLIEQIDTSRPVVLIGTSLGGMLAVEISKRIKVEHIFLISTIKNKSEQPAYFNFFRWFPLYEWMPNKVIANPDFWLKILFPEGMKSEWKVMFKDMFSKWSPSFLRWALRASLQWKNDTKIDNFTHIHGGCDIVFPHAHLSDFHLIKSGTHIMVLTKARELKAIIQAELQMKFN
jgi:pimeloyl-ACP methyl ester carboxylesterase